MRRLLPLLLLLRLCVKKSTQSKVGVEWRLVRILLVRDGDARMHCNRSNRVTHGADTGPVYCTTVEVGSRCAVDRAENANLYTAARITRYRGGHLLSTCYA
jgi:hypothetical protein